MYATISGSTETIAAVRRLQRHRETVAADDSFDSSGTNTRRHRARHCAPPQGDTALTLATAVAHAEEARVAARARAQATWEAHREARPTADGPSTERSWAPSDGTPTDTALATAVALGSTVRPDVLRCVLQLTAAQPRANIPSLDISASYLAGPPREGRPVTPEQPDAEANLD